MASHKLVFVMAVMAISALAQPVSTAPNTQAWAISPDRTTLWVASVGEIDKIDIASQQRTQQFLLNPGETPSCIAVHPTLGLVIQIYNPNASFLAADTFYGALMNPTTGTITNKIVLGQYGGPYFGSGDCTVGAEGTIYLTSGFYNDPQNPNGGNKVAAINPNTLAVTTMLPVSDAVSFIASGDGVTFLLGIGERTLTAEYGFMDFIQGDFVLAVPTPLPFVAQARPVFSPDGKTAFMSGNNCTGTGCPSPRIGGTATVNVANEQVTAFVNGFEPDDLAFSGTDTGFEYALFDQSVAIVQVNFTANNTWNNTALEFWDNPDGSSGNQQLLVNHNMPDQWHDTLMIRQSNDVLFMVVPHPAPFITQVISAGQPYAPGPIAPDQWIAVQGGSLASAVSYPTTATLPTTLDTTQVVFQYSGKMTLGPMNYVGPNQVNVQVPSDVPLGSGTVSLTTQTVNADGSVTASNAVQLDVVSAVPELFVATDANYRPIASGNAAAPGSTIVLWAGGLGPVVNPLTGASFLPATGQAAPLSPLMQTATQPVVTIGGVPATVQFSGLCPGLAGCYIINVTVPNLLSGSQSMTVALPPSVAAKTVSPIMVQ